MSLLKPECDPESPVHLRIATEYSQVDVQKGCSVVFVLA